MSGAAAALAAPASGLEAHAGFALVESDALPLEAVDQLFLTCFAAMVAVWAGGNLLLLDPVALRGSSAVALVGIGVLFTFYTASRLTRSLSWGIISTVALLAAVTYAGSTWVTAGAGAVLLAATLFAGWKLRVAHWQPAVPVAVLAAVVILGCQWAYTSFDMLARVDAGRVHQDTLFHASIAAMIKNYGVVSTGLNGLVETPYHHLSHVLMAAFSVLAGVSVLEAYGAANWIVFAPLLLLAVVATSSLLMGGHRPERQWMLWGVATVALSVFPYLFSRWGLSDAFFVSESYLVSLVPFSLGLAILFTRRPGMQAVAAAVLLTVLMAASKASVGLMFAGLWLARAMFLRTERRWLDWLAAFLALAAAAATVWASARASSGTLWIAPLHYVEFLRFGAYVAAIRASLAMGQPSSFDTWRLAVLAVVSFAAFHFLPSWLVLFRAYCLAGARRMLALPIIVYAAAATGAALFIVAVFGIPGGSHYYFTNVTFFLALPVLVGWSTGTLETLRVDGRIARMVGVCIVTFIGAEALHERSYLSRVQGAPPNALVQQLRQMRATSPKDQVLRATPEMLAANPVKRCPARPFLFPAVSERPWQGVIVPTADRNCRYINYTYEQYGLTGPLQQVTRPPVMPAAGRDAKR